MSFSPDGSRERLAEWAKPDPAWHRQQLAAAATASDWFAVAFHLQRLLALAPGDAALQRRLADAKAKGAASAARPPTKP